MDIVVLYKKVDGSFSCHPLFIYNKNYKSMSS